MELIACIPFGKQAINNMIKRRSLVFIAFILYVDLLLLQK
jgi:hypothetical protein